VGPVNAQLPPVDPGARRSLRARLAAGPLARRIALLDVRLYGLVRSSVRARALETSIARFSRLGEHGALWLALGAAGALVDVPRRRLWVHGATSIVATYSVTTAVKGIVRRRRPVHAGLPALVATPTSLSFPSSHASSSFAAARAYAALVPPGPLYAAATAMALSRVYLGVHYPSDIAAGALLGSVLGTAGR
jgi:membrane-associated phospholipid phosphatase